MWKGKTLKKLFISVDLVLGIKPTTFDATCQLIDSGKYGSYIAICKSKRHDYFSEKQSKKTHGLLKPSGSLVERAYINSLPINAKRGLILAKAVRITSIAKPDEDLSSTFCLAEDVAIDELISSHILKSCLITLAQSWKADESEATMTSLTPSKWAISTYDQLRLQLASKCVLSWMSGRLVYCVDCIAENGCCMKRKLMLAMTRKILQWLQDNEAQLQDIDYADDVDTEY